MGINETIGNINPQINWQDLGKNIGLKILFWSSYVRAWIINQLIALGLPLKPFQLNLVMILLNIILLIWLIYILNKVAKPILVIIGLILAVWILIGFFYLP